MVAPEALENKTAIMREQRLFVGNLPNGTSESDLQKLFKKYNVSNVEIKRKNVLDQESIFAFVNVASNRLESCLKEIGDREWNNCKLKVEVAKESFLERLKKERSKRTNTETAEVVKPTYVFHNQASKNRKIIFDSDDDLSDAINSSNELSSHCSKRNLPMFRGMPSSENVHERTSDEFVAAETTSTITTKHLTDKKLAVNVSMKKFEEFSDVWKDDNPADSFRYTSDSALKRRNSLYANSVRRPDQCARNDRKLVNNSKYAAEVKRKTALEEKWNSIKDQKDTIKNALKNMISVNKKSLRFSQYDDEPASSTAEQNNEPESVTKNDTKKVVLFDDSEEDEFEPNFEVKPHLEGEQGLKLLKFKSKFANNDRFKLDERFLEEDETRSKADSVPSMQQKRPMIRYDPTKSGHQALEKKARSDLSTPENKKKKMKKRKIEGENKKLEPVKPEVSKEKYYSVTDDLKDAFKKTEEKRVFSLSAIFDEKLKHDEKPADKHEETVPVKKIKYVEDPFHTISEDENSVDDEAPLEVLPVTVGSEKVLGKCGVWGETFFFQSNDSRLKESVEFYKPSEESRITRNTDFSKQRIKLKQIVRKKIQNSRRDNKLFKQKLGGKLNKAKFKMRLKKASL